MAKKVLDNCTIYRLLDGIDKEKQRELCLNALKSYNQESKELSEEKRELFNKAFELLANNNKEALIILKEFVLNNESVRKNEIELLIVHKRMEYLQGFITLEEMQAAIHDLMLDDAYHFYKTEYQCRLYDLLSRDPQEYDSAIIDDIRHLKEESIEKKLNPVCGYPD